MTEKNQLLQKKVSDQIYDNLMRQIYDELFKELTIKQIRAIIDRVITADDMVLKAEITKIDTTDEKEKANLLFLNKARDIALKNLRKDVFQIYYQITN